MKNYYTPLPKSLTIHNSEVHGLGLFSTEDIKKDTLLGITHVKDDRFPDGYIRTPLGGFFNHSQYPNVKIISDDQYLYIVTLCDIKAGDEILAVYTLYDPTK
jgi:SET domain-containing protein